MRIIVMLFVVSGTLIAACGGEPAAVDVPSGLETPVSDQFRTSEFEPKTGVARAVPNLTTAGAQSDKDAKIARLESELARWKEIERQRSEEMGQFHNMYVSAREKNEELTARNERLVADLKTIRARYAETSVALTELEERRKNEFGTVFSDLAEAKKDLEWVREAYDYAEKALVEAREESERLREAHAVVTSSCGPPNTPP